ncbi:MAG: endonuclease/exonuclease/phosphatase family protein [Bacteroidales bacterium]|nr:endonuclease/exonuclease/phosphatase family protein [Bacteroidales bacterium]
MKIRNILAIIAFALTFIPAARAAGDTPDEITVISYNIRMGEAKDGTNSWEYRYPASALMIDDQKPDVFGLQEAFDYQVKYMDEYCQGYKCVGVGREDGKHKGEHMSIFYNTKTVQLLKWGTYWLSETPDKPSKGWDAACVRTATWTLMKDKKNGKKFYYVNTHLDHVGREAQRKGLELIVNKIKEMNKEGYPMILTGDFNVEPTDSVLDGLNSMMTSARESAVKTDKDYTYNGWGKSKATIDYIYYSGFSAAPVFEVVRKPYMERTFISDHFPVKAVLVF